MKPTLHLLMGLPGSGKTTLARAIQKTTDAARVSSDDYRLMLYPEPKFTQKEHDNIYALLDHNVEHLLQAGHDVVYDANLNRRHHRQEKYDLASRYDANVKLWWVCVPDGVAKERRLSEQNHLLVPEGETAEKMFDRIAAVIEEPGDDEPHQVVDGTAIGEAYVQTLL